MIAIFIFVDAVVMICVIWVSKTFFVSFWNYMLHVIVLGGADNRDGFSAQACIYNSHRNPWLP